MVTLWDNGSTHEETGSARGSELSKATDPGSDESGVTPKHMSFFFFCCLFSLHDFCHVSVGGGKVTQRLDSLNLLCPLMTKGEQFSPECSAELQMLGCCFLTPCVLFLPN